MRVEQISTQQLYLQYVFDFHPKILKSVLGVSEAKLCFYKLILNVEFHMKMINFTIFMYDILCPNMEL